jgi:hypothetical protein
VAAGYPVGAEGRSFAVDYGINDALGMNNRMVGAERGDR